MQNKRIRLVKKVLAQKTLKSCKYKYWKRKIEKTDVWQRPITIQYTNHLVNQCNSVISVNQKHDTKTWAKKKKKKESILGLEL